MKACVCMVLVANVLMGAVLHASGSETGATITVHAEGVRFRLAEEVIGANMEDLQYQTFGGFDSQLIHGESFFEPSPTELAQTSGRIDGFTTVRGTWDLIPDGSVQVTIADKHQGARLTSDAPAPSNTVEVAAEFLFASDAERPAGLILHVDGNHADNACDWYSGYTISLQPQSQDVVLSSAYRASARVERGRAAVKIERGAWIPVVVGVSGGKVRVCVNGAEVLVVDEAKPLPVGRYGIMSRGDVKCRNLSLANGQGKRQVIPFQTGSLLRQPGEAISLRWAAVRTGDAQGAFELVNPGNGTWFPNCRSQKIIYRGGKGELGIDNAGLERWGINLCRGKTYEGFLRVRTTGPTEFCVSLRSADGKRIYASRTLKTAGGDGFEKVAFTLKPNTKDADGRFAVTLTQPGELTLGYAFLQPGEWGRFKGLPIRKDLAEALVEQGIKLLRLNGAMIEVRGYRWKTLQGDRDTRPPYDGFYDRYCSGGYGPIEHLNFCEAAGFKPVVALNLEETPETVADFIAYCNAPTNTPAGWRRALAGHPRPYQLKHYQVGNESRLDAGYVEKFKQVAEAVWEVDPDITLIPVGHGYPFTGAEPLEELRAKLTNELALARFVASRGRKLLWDHHLFYMSDNPAESYHGALPGAAVFARALTTLDPSVGPVKVGVFEFNAARFHFNRGLAHAVELNQANRMGDVVVAGAMPNVSQPWNVYQGEWNSVLWTQGNIYYTQDKVWFQAAYYVQQMIARDWAPDVVACDVSAKDRGLDVLAAKTTDGRKLVLRVVNLSKEDTAASLKLSGFVPRRTYARATTLAHDDLLGYNSLECPEAFKPVQSTWKHRGNPAQYVFPGNSFTVLVLE